MTTDTLTKHSFFIKKVSFDGLTDDLVTHLYSLTKENIKIPSGVVQLEVIASSLIDIPFNKTEEKKYVDLKKYISESAAKELASVDEETFIDKINNLIK